MSGENLQPAQPASPPAPAATDGSAAPDVMPGSSPADVQADSSPADVTPAASSAAEGVDRQSLLDVTKAALAATKPKTDGQDSPSNSGQETGKPDADSQATTTPEDKKSQAQDGKDKTSESEGDDDFSDADTLDFGKHPRFKKLLSQWSRDREPAQQFRTLTTFMRENGVSHEQAAQALKLAALLSHAQRGSVEHAKLFLADVMPAVQQLRQLTGEEIAPDLQERQAAGAIDEQTARELTQQRQQAAAAKRREEERAVEDAARETSELRNAIVKAVSDWDASVRTRDPDFSRKEILIKSRIQAIAAEEGPPRTAQEAVALAERAYRDVNKAFEGLVPPTPTPKKQTRPVAANGRGSLSASQVRPVPKSPIDITRQALGMRTA